MGQSESKRLAHLDNKASKYVQKKVWDKAASCYLKLATCYEYPLSEKREADTFHAAVALVNAAKCLKSNKSFGSAIATFGQARDLFIKSKDVTMAANQCEEIAEVYYERKDFRSALKCYQEAGEMLGNHVYNKTWKKRVAKLAILLEEYRIAGSIYEEFAQEGTHQSGELTKHATKKYFLQAGLCHLCNNMFQGLELALEHYLNIDPTFIGSDEYKLLRRLANAALEANIEEFDICIEENLKMTNWDPCRVLVVHARKKIEEKKREQEENFDPRSNFGLTLVPLS